jgi:hypothetical protein
MPEGEVKAENEKAQPKKKEEEKKTEEVTPAPEAVKNVAADTAKMLDAYKAKWAEVLSKSPDAFKLSGKGGTIIPPEDLLRKVPVIMWEQQKSSLSFRKMFNTEEIAKAAVSALTSGPKTDPLEVRLQSAGFLPSEDNKRIFNQNYAQVMGVLLDKAVGTTVISTPALHF